MWCVKHIHLCSLLALIYSDFIVYNDIFSTYNGWHLWVRGIFAICSCKFTVLRLLSSSYKFKKNLTYGTPQNKLINHPHMLILGRDVITDKEFVNASYVSVTLFHKIEF